MLRTREWGERARALGDHGFSARQEKGKPAVTHTVGALADGLLDLLVLVAILDMSETLRIGNE